MKIFPAPKIRELDAFTIQNEPVASIDLMERAALTFAKWMQEKYPDENCPLYFFCGSGNNGGDGLAVARILQQRFYNCSVFLVSTGGEMSADCQTNLQCLEKMRSVPIQKIETENDFPVPPENAILIDAIFGSGLNRPLEGLPARLIERLNSLPNERVAIDIPSGLFADRHTTGLAFKAQRTLTFELPKLAFFLAENQDETGDWEVCCIGLDKKFIESQTTDFQTIEPDFLKSFLKKRKKFDHKGTYGHALMIAGSYGKVGAAVLAAKACLRSGCGLVTVHAPRSAYEILQISFPEAMVSVDSHQFVFCEVPNLNKYQAVGAGCGLGNSHMTEEALAELLEQCKLPLVLDADALNLLSKNQHLLQKLSPDTILTPHPKEFERLFGKTENDFERLELLRQKAAELNCFIALKGAYTCVATPEGKCFFNTTGNPGMGTGGTGDVLTGMLTGLLAQGYTALQACLLGVYLHGLAGDIAAQNTEQEALLASDLIACIGKAFAQLHESKA